MLPELRHVRVGTLEEVLAFLAEHPTGTRLVAGGTDLVIELRKAEATTGKLNLLDLSALDGISGIREKAGKVVIGAMTRHAAVGASELLGRRARLLRQAAASVGAAQIRNRGTVGGNLVNAAPCADLVAPLVALGAKVRLRSLKGEREFSVEEFITGPYQTQARPDEILTEVVFEALPENASSVYVRLGRRDALAIMRLSMAVILVRDGQGRVKECRIVPGAATPRPHRVTEAEALLVGNAVDESLAERAGAVVSAEVIRETGRRWSTPYKEPVVAALCRRAVLQAAGLEAVERKEASLEWTERREPPAGDLPEVASPSEETGFREGETVRVRFVVNGERRDLTTTPNRTLARVLREDLHLTGTKIGCEVGECGACTVLMDGRAVNSCLVLVGQAEGCDIITIEGLSPGGELHPLQEAFLDEAAVQCGFCTPGMILSAKALLDAKPDPTREEIVAALSGNLCRCTGYEQIIRAVETAARKMSTLRRG